MNLAKLLFNQSKGPEWAREARKRNGVGRPPKINKERERTLYSYRNGNRWWTIQNGDLTGRGYRRHMRKSGLNVVRRTSEAIKRYGKGT